jgi:hypothetical protein
MRKKIKVLFATVLIICVSAFAMETQETKYLLFNSGQFDLSSKQSAQQALKDVMNNFDSLPESNVKVGVSAIFSYLQEDPQAVADKLANFLWASKQTGTPVLVKFDGEQWWDARPDLWNWWDPNKPGYNPDNRKNVEWTWWSPEHAMKIAWRNWGRQIRVLPPPNLMSPSYRQAVYEGMDILMPVIMDWWKQLPEDEKYLFVGLNVGWETSIGYNAFYYPNGNDYLDKPESSDPTRGTIREDVLDRGQVQTGYAALSTAGIRCKGDITEDDLVEVCRRHLEELSRHAYEFGFPRDKIFTHGVGNEFGEELYDAAVNEYSCPAWSGYWYADDPSKDKGIMRNIKRSDAPCWAVAEYLLLKPYSEVDLWQSAFEKTLSYPGCRFLSVYNWEGISAEDSRVVEAAKKAVKTLSDSCENNHNE